jgi:hypothetical protein
MTNGRYMPRSKVVARVYDDLSVRGFSVPSSQKLFITAIHIHSLPVGRIAKHFIEIAAPLGQLVRLTLQGKVHLVVFWSEQS